MIDDISWQPAVKATAATQKAAPQEAMPSHLLLQFACTSTKLRVICVATVSNSGLLTVNHGQVSVLE